MWKTERGRWKVCSMQREDIYKLLERRVERKQTDGQEEQDKGESERDDRKRINMNGYQEIACSIWLECMMRTETQQEIKLER